MMLLTDIPPFSVTSVYSVRDKWPIGIKTLIASRKKIHLSATGRPALWIAQPKAFNLNTKEGKIVVNHYCLTACLKGTR
jgi:hypothetical protein